MLNTIIIEDEHQAANLLEAMIQDAGLDIMVLDKCPDLASGVKSIKKHKPDIVFLDIELPVYSGIELLNFFNPEEINFHIIFTTASNEYAVRAFEMSAVDYLMKPIQEEKLQAALEKIVRIPTIKVSENLPILKNNLHPSVNKKIVVPVANGYEVLNLNDICYLKADGSYTRLFFRSNTNMLVSKNLKHFEFILSDISYFIRVHRSFIVNIHRIKKVLRKDGGTVFLENEAELPIAEDKIQLILNALKML